MHQSGISRPEAILFDFGGTLMQTNFERAKWIKHWLKLANNPRNVTFEMVWEYGDELITAAYRNRPLDLVEFPRVQFERNLRDRLGVTFEISDEDLDREFVDTSYHEEPEAGVMEMLESLSQLAIPMGVVSNSVLQGSSLASVLERNGMRKHFHFVMSSSDFGFRKPHPELFRSALARIGTKTENTWYVGDRLDADVMGSQLVGMKGVWYNPERKSRETETIVPDMELHHWDELFDLCNSI